MASFRSEGPEENHNYLSFTVKKLPQRCCYTLGIQGLKVCLAKGPICFHIDFSLSPTSFFPNFDAEHILEFLPDLSSDACGPT